MTINTFVRCGIPLLAALFLLSCAKDPASGYSDGIDRTTIDAYATMENLFAAPGDITSKDFSAAETKFTDVLKADPQNASANFGAAFCRLLGTARDSELIGAINGFNGPLTSGTSPLLAFGIPNSPASVGDPASAVAAQNIRLYRTALSSPGVVAELQRVLRDRLLPRVEYALACLAIVEQHPDFSLKISGRMQGNPGASAVTLDLTEVFLMDAALQGVRSQIEAALIFQFPLTDQSPTGLAAALSQTNTSFFVRASDGIARGGEVKSSLLAMAAKVRAAHDFLKNETDDQSNDIIKKSDIGALSSLVSIADKLDQCVNGTFTTSARYLFRDTSVTLSVNLGAFLQNIPQYPKSAWFPPYTVQAVPSGHLQWHWTAADPLTAPFPDPTFSGLLPGMTTERLKGILGFDDLFAWRLSVSVMDIDNSSANYNVSMTVGGQSIAPTGNAFVVTSGKGSPVVLTVQQNGVTIPYDIVDGGPLSVQYMKYETMGIDVTPSPKNITGAYSAAAGGVTLTLQWYAHYIVERSVNGGAFAPVDTIYSSQYTDLHTSAATAYQYRVRRWFNVMNADHTADRANNYSNVVAVSRP